MSPSYPSPSTFITHATDVASFYGFQPIREIERSARRARTQGGMARIEPTRTHSFSSAMSACTTCVVQKSTEPVLAFYATPTPSHLPPAFSPRDTAEFGLQVVGTPERLGEVLLLKTLFAITTEWGTPVSRVRVNALGDRDSKVRFERELGSYLRKNAHHLDPTCREELAHNPCGTYNCSNEVCRQILADGPRAMNFLSEKSRQHFRQVLEQIEGLGLPYELDDLLVGDEREPRIVFALDLAKEDGTILTSIGGRFDEYAKRMTGKKEGAAVSASIFFRKKGSERGNFTTTTATTVPKVYFVQLGSRAKLQGLAVLDMLRQAQIPVLQSFDAKSLSPQLESARTLGVPYLLIMGQREALDGTIIIRSMKTSSQNTLTLSALPKYLKTIR